MGYVYLTAKIENPVEDISNEYRFIVDTLHDFTERLF